MFHVRTPSGSCGIYKGFIRKCFRTDGLLSQRGSEGTVSIRPRSPWSRPLGIPWACALHPGSRCFLSFAYSDILELKIGSKGIDIGTQASDFTEISLEF